jgi:hypothetical protein
VIIERWLAAPQDAVRVDDSVYISPNFTTPQGGAAE